MSSRVIGHSRPSIAAPHLRTDPWWGLPIVVVIVLGSFIVYSTWAAFQNAHYFAPPYLSPFYSPCLYRSCLHPSFGFGLPDIQLPIIWLTPPACAVPDLKRGYTGETKFPLILQAFHRYTWYLAVLFIVMLTWDAILAFRFPNGFGVGVGTIVMWINVILLAGYTFSCHSCRHVCGGYVNVFSKAPGRYRVWHFLTRLNERHPMYAWLSLFSVGLTDLYIRLVSMGVIRDLRII
jgi:hypothetical protein